jgi:putative PIN family toxin of toxin-antitoxin system
MKVFLDSNVLASAVATRGLCADVLREVFASHQLIISDQVLDELERVLTLKFHVRPDLVHDFIWLLQQGTFRAQRGQVPGLELQDKDDIHIVGAALAAGAEVLVTGDKGLLSLGHMDDLEILSPRQFWERLTIVQ